MVSLQPGDQLISLYYGSADDPYSIVLRQAAKPYKVCTCPSYSFGKGRTCKHIVALRTGKKDGSILTNDKFKLTEFGKELLKL